MFINYKTNFTQIRNQLHFREKLFSNKYFIFKTIKVDVAIMKFLIIALAFDVLFFLLFR